MIRRPPRSTRTDTLFPYTTLFRSRPPYDGQLTALDGGLRHVVECEHGAERRLIEEAPQLLVAVVIVEASTGEQHRAVEQLLLETRFVGNDRFLNDRTRSEERRVGKEGVGTCRSRGAP